MDLANLTPFAAEGFRQLRGPEDFYGVVAACARLTFGADGVATVDADQSFLWEDRYADHGSGRYLEEQSDFIPFKPRTDVTALAAAWAPDGAPVDEILCGLRVEGRVEKRLRVVGARVWRHEGETGGWRLSPPEPFVSAPLLWALARGGALTAAADGPVDEENPWGCGRVDLSRAPRDSVFAAPRILADDEDADADAEDWRAPAPAQGLAPLPPVSDFRLRHAGTYDEAWLAARHPYLPQDFCPDFWQCAHPDLTLAPYLAGDETITLGRLRRDAPLLRLTLPGVRLVLRLHWPDGHEDRSLALDGVHLDCRGERVTMKLTWRTAFLLRGQEDLRLVLRATDMNGARRDWRERRPKGGRR